MVLIKPPCKIANIHKMAPFFMSNKTLPLDERLYTYLLSVSLREPEVLRRLREETAQDRMAMKRQDVRRET